MISRKKFKKLRFLRNFYRLRYELLLIISIVLFMIRMCRNSNNIYQKESHLTNIRSTANIDKHLHKNIRCYTDHDFHEKLSLFKIDDILRNKRKPKKAKTIFFHITSCSENGQLKLNARQICAIESAALLNRNFDIFVLFASPISYFNQSQLAFDNQKIFQQYDNIYLRNVNIWRYADDTPLYEWLDNGKLFYSHYIEEHISDFLRYLTLWRWGGTNLDLDIILRNSLEDIKPNFVGATTSENIGNAVINLDYAGMGHQSANMLLEDCQTNFNPYLRNSIGSLLIMKLLKKICSIPVTELMTRERCSGFKVFEKEAFYPIDISKINILFEKKYLKKSLRLIKQSIAMYVPNKISRNFTVNIGDDVAYAIYAKKYCPNVYNSCDNFF